MSQRDLHLYWASPVAYNAINVLSQCTGEIHKLQADKEELIRIAYEAGCSSRFIAEYADISHQTVLRICKEDQ